MGQKIDGVVPVHGAAEKFATERRGNVLNDLRVVSRIVAAQVVAVDQVNVRVLAGSDQQVRRGTASLSGQQSRAAGAEVSIVQSKVGLVEWREVVLDREGVCTQ